MADSSRSLIRALNQTRLDHVDDPVVDILCAAFLDGVAALDMAANHESCTEENLYLLVKTMIEHRLRQLREGT